MATNNCQDLDPVPGPGDIPLHTGSDAAMRRIVQWVDNCNQNHPQCGRIWSKRNGLLHNFIPKRLIDVGQKGDSTVKVVEAKANHISDKYMTLSHCWGQKKMFTLVEATEKQCKDGVALKELSKTFQESIKVVRDMGIKYIWIDSLCIVQDNQEFKVEGHTMHQVYRNSYCNLTAADSTGGDGGLFRERLAGEVIPLKVCAPNSKLLGGGNWRVFPTDLWDRQLMSQHLFTRAWVYQERVLSVRLVHFTSTQLMWECATLSACEGLPNGLPFSLDATSAGDRHWRDRLQYSDQLRYISPLSGSMDLSPETFWRSAVRTYTSCDITDPRKDKLKAIWGIAKLVRDIFCERYAVGLFEANLHEQLAWKVKDPSRAERLDKVGDQKIPSWSWASINGSPIEIADRLKFSKERHMVVKDPEHSHICFTLKGEDEHTKHSSEIKTWRDQISYWDKSMEEADPKDERPRVHRKQSSQYSDEHPLLDEKRLGIHIRGNIVHAPVIQEKEKDGIWRLDIKLVNPKKCHYYPDLVPPSSVSGSAGSFAVVLAGSIVDDAEDGSYLYHATGISLERAHGLTFRRTGSFHLHDIREQEWQIMEKTSFDELGITKPENGPQSLDFWLE